MSRTPNETKQQQFRLKEETLQDLDTIAGYLVRMVGGIPSRTAAVRYAARETAKKIQKKMREEG